MNELPRIEPYEARHLLFRAPGRAAFAAVDREREIPVTLWFFEEPAVLPPDVCHRNVVGVYRHGTRDGYDYWITEPVTETARELLDREGPLAPSRAIPLVVGVARGLSALIAAGGPARVVAPEDVALTSDGTPKLLPFFLARTVEGDEAEALRASLGLLYAELLTARRPDPRDPLALAASEILRSLVQCGIARDTAVREGAEALRRPAIATPTRTIPAPVRRVGEGRRDGPRALLRWSPAWVLATALLVGVSFRQYLLDPGTGTPTPAPTGALLTPEGNGPPVGPGERPGAEGGDYGPPATVERKETRARARAAVTPRGDRRPRVTRAVGRAGGASNSSVTPRGVAASSGARHRVTAPAATHGALRIARRAESRTASVAPRPSSPRASGTPSQRAKIAGRRAPAVQQRPAWRVAQRSAPDASGSGAPGRRLASPGREGLARREEPSSVSGTALRLARLPSTPPSSPPPVVRLKVIVGRDGLPEAAVVVRSSGDRERDIAAVQAARQTRFAPPRAGEGKGRAAGPRVTYATVEVASAMAPRLTHPAPETP